MATRNVQNQLLSEAYCRCSTIKNSDYRPWQCSNMYVLYRRKCEEILYRPAFNNSLRLSLKIGRGDVTCDFCVGVDPRRRRSFFGAAFSSACRRSMSATICAKDRKSTSACASVVLSSIVILSSLQYYGNIGQCSVLASNNHQVPTFNISSN